MIYDSLPQAAYSLTWVVRNSTSVEMGMNSVERIEYYTKVENEKYQGNSSNQLWSSSFKM